MFPSWTNLNVFWTIWTLKKGKMATRELISVWTLFLYSQSFVHTKIMISTLPLDICDTRILKIRSYFRRKAARKHLFSLESTVLIQVSSSFSKTKVKVDECLWNIHEFVLNPIKQTFWKIKPGGSINANTVLHPIL